MKKMDLLHYLNQEIDKKFGDYDVALDWDVRNHSIEIIVRLFAENSQHLAIDDAAGVVSEEEIIEFEDSILLYDPKKTTFDAQDYLSAIPYEGKKGMRQAMVDALLDYLLSVLEHGQSELLDFLDNENEDAVFELVWQDDAFGTIVDNYEGAQQEYIAYPSY